MSGKGLLPAVAQHPLVQQDLLIAVALSTLLRESITKGNQSTYTCGFNALVEFCRSRNLCSLPVDAVTLCAWMMVKAESCLVKTVEKYVCGIRFAHIMAGMEWNLSSHPLVKQTLVALRKRQPVSNALQKVPLSLSLLLKMCGAMISWPKFSAMRFDDLAWATASSVAFFAALRGGEFFVQPKSERPLLKGADLQLMSSAQGPYVLISVPSPKTRKDLDSIPAVAASPSSSFVFDPVKLLQAYRARAELNSIDVLGAQAAFKMFNGKPIDRRFMISTAELLRAKANITILNSKGKSIKVSAASWRAGFVMSSRCADVPSSVIRSNGRWTSAGGPIPYMVDTIQLFQKMADQIITEHNTRTRTDAGGRFVASALLL